MAFGYSFLTIFLLGWILSASDLQEMPIYTLQDGETYYLRAEYCNIENSQFTMKGRCYSFSDDGTIYTDATSPGPTLKMIAGTQFEIILENNFVNSVQSEPSCHNEYCEMDVTNLHTHGLHISSEQDDVLVRLAPRQSADDDPTSVSYTYTILATHYPGIHWYHPHQHGSVSHQIHFGMFGALITEYESSSNYDAVGDTKLYTDGDNSYITNILVFSGVYAVNKDLCDDCSLPLDTLHEVDVDTFNGEGIGAYGRCNVHGKDCFHQYSLCYEFCAFEGSWRTSGLEYDVEITSQDSNDDDNDGIDQFVVVNGQYNPTLEITVNKFRRLQFLNALHQYYIHYQFPTPSDGCQVYLLGYDGIFFDDDFPRNLNVYNNELLLAPGSRGDLLIKCTDQGEYVVTTISIDGQSSMRETDFDDLERVGSDQIDGIKKLFTISVVQDAGDDITELPSKIPDKPKYLKDLRAESTVDNSCACNQYTFPECGDGCCIVYNSRTAFEVDGEVFQSGERYLTYLIQDRVYEFNLKTDRHVHHQHVYPFQLQQDIGQDGFIGKAGDYFDTMGAEFERNIRMYTADFSGYMVLHCHLLPHEDKGMMGLFYVLTQDQADGVSPSPNPTQAPTETCLNDLNQGQGGTVTSPTPPPTPKSGGGKGGGGGKRGASVLFDFDQHGDHTLYLLVSMFIALTLCNTMVLIYKYFIKTGVATNKKYVAVLEKDIDDL